jgi:beta-lactamase class C
MGAWLRVLLGNRPDIIAPENLDYIFDPVVKNRNRGGFYGWGGVKDNYYGIGWRIVNWPEKSIIYHGGSVNGYRSEIAIDRENKIGICVLFNSNNRYAAKVIPEFIKAYEAFLEKESQNAEVASLSSVTKVRS